MRTLGSPESIFIDSRVVMSKLDPADLVGAGAVSRTLRLSHAPRVTTYLRRYADSPKAVVDVSGSHVRLWDRQDVERRHAARAKR